MQILLVAATQAEIAPTLAFLEKHPKKEQVIISITGIGGMCTAYHLAHALHPEYSKIDIAINAGIAGSYHTDWALGKVVQVISERVADLGIEEADGTFKTLEDIGLVSSNTFPYTEEILCMPAEHIGNFLPTAQGLSVNRVHGSAKSIAIIRQKFPQADIETMEGAAFFYAALHYAQKHKNFRFLALRAISNHVEPRDKSKWQIPLAIHNLNDILISMLEALLY